MVFLTIATPLSGEILLQASYSNASPSMVPVGAIFYELNATVTSVTFELAQFDSESDLTGHYEVVISVLLWIDGAEDKEGFVILYNLWNSSDPVMSKSTTSGGVGCA